MSIEKSMVERLLDLNEQSLKNTQELLDMIRKQVKDNPNDAELGALIRKVFTQVNNDKS